jgi:GMP synthase (glutamine-hydrolysing)
MKQQSPLEGKAIILQHEQHEGLELLEPALVAAGFTLIKRFRHVEREDLDAPLVVVLGGSMGVYDAHEHPFLSHELAFLSERLALNRPTLGICLGAQLLAAAAGATVSPGKNGLELGVAPVRLTAAAATDPVFQGLPPKLTVAHWHADTFTPVDGATLLASTDRYTQQAFRLGTSYGVQFHPELGAASFTHWLALGEEALRAQGKKVEELRAQAGKLGAAEGQLEDLCARFAFHFASLAR